MFLIFLRNNVSSKQKGRGVIAVENENKKTKQTRYSLRLKLNILIAISILVTSVGLVLITYNTHCRQINRIYLDSAGRAAYVAADIVFSDYLKNFKEQVDTDEFRELRERAVSENDPDIISDWLKSKKGYSDGTEENNTLLDDYDLLLSPLLVVEDAFPLTELQYDYDKDNVTYILVDTTEGFLGIGKVETAIEEFSGYADNTSIPATVYHLGKDWLCTSCTSIKDYDTGENFALACADIDMNNVVLEQRWFLYNSIIFIVILILILMLISMLIIRIKVINPLRHLQRGAARFVSGKSGTEKAYTMYDVMDLNIRNRDEIGDLYQEMRDMQISIVKDTEKVTAITAEKERIQTELDLAARIQTSALPKISPGFSNQSEFTLAAFMTPAKDVGGDFYDFFYLDDDRLALVIADVSGKGIPAALFMMTAKDRLNSRANAGGTAAEILADVNIQLCKNNPANMFVTVWFGILDLKSGVLTASNAGHEDPVLKYGNGPFELMHDKHSLVLGGFERTKYENYEIVMKPGDILFVYTDGVPEASRGKNRFFGTDRMLDTLNRCKSAEPDALIKSMRRALSDYTGDMELFDDVTMLCIRYDGTHKDR